MTALCWINNKKVIHIASKRFENWRRATVGDIALVNSSRLIYLLMGWVRERLLKTRFGGMEHRLFTNRKQDALRTNQLENESLLQEAVKNTLPSLIPWWTLSHTVERKMNIHQVININRISTLTKLLRKTALVLHFARKVKKQSSWRKKRKSKIGRVLAHLI